MTTRNKPMKCFKNINVALALLWMFMALQAQGHTINTNSTRFRDQNDNGCHMSPGAAGAPASGAAGAGGDHAKFVPCKADSGICPGGGSESPGKLHTSRDPLSF